MSHPYRFHPYDRSAGRGRGGFKPHGGNVGPDSSLSQPVPGRGPPPRNEMSRSGGHNADHPPVGMLRTPSHVGGYGSPL
eukprot:CAMPEP_0119141552 /NCGR_PEP_ID=MMETSP1310-20130426/31221_1 /TAXON_ID=464262 /ORGANISM="Genus nov. species nov., Strain RCC2339" /LENGTH=78 /DNA_ID=CAMNT_0007133007 /DNA_START=44 /DNA_END=277 /DNA_ORIENTATION=-